nr:hypothetical protein [Candidatus Symbiopectobacterium sp.]
MVICSDDYPKVLFIQQSQARIQCGPCRYQGIFYAISLQASADKLYRNLPRESHPAYLSAIVQLFDSRGTPELVFCTLFQEIL